MTDRKQAPEYHLTDMDYFTAALAQAYYSGMDLIDVLKASQDSRTAQELDAMIDDLSDYIPPEIILSTEDMQVAIEIMQSIPGLRPKEEEG